MTRLLLVRHGRSTWNEAGRWQGWADPPLSTVGEEQCRAAAAVLRSTSIAAVVSSDLQRARRTAEVMAELLAIDDVQSVAGFRERNAGDWTGMTRAEIERRWPGAIADYFSGRIPSPPGGEDTPTFVGRALAAITETATGRDGHNVLVVTHSGLIRALERHAGVPAGVVPNLAGRWFGWDDRLTVGEAVDLLGQPASATE